MTAVMRILLVEDNAKLAGLLKQGLTEASFAVDWFETFEAAQEALRSFNYDLILLDLGLPDGEGIELVRQIRRRGSSTPILIMTARGGLDDRIVGLDTGADDYLVKPFAISELAARCRALLRRPGASLGTVLTAANIAVDTTAREVRVNGERISMPPRELGLLEHLMRQLGKVVPKTVLEETLYALDAEVTPNALEAAVSRLRRRLAATGASAVLHTAHGIGYILVAAPDQPSASG
jgi:DNA-binding response OmpR family regulator